LHDRWNGMRDLTVTEQWMLAPAVAIMFVVGLYPQLVSGMVHGTVMQLVGLVRY
jgi:NADH-quinone oxidoreductase subunit M